MEIPDQAVITNWLAACRNGMTQQALADDIAATTGWAITRDRYSKYESGSLPVGRQSLARFVDYWTRKGKSGPDFTPKPEPQPELDLVGALREQTAAINALVLEMRLARERDLDAAGAMVRAAKALVSLRQPAEAQESTEPDALRG